MNEQRLRWALLALLIAAWGLRLYQLEAQSLWYDEGVTAQVARQGLAELTRWTADDIQPPLYYYVMAAWVRLAGASEWALRFPSAAWGLLMLPLIYALGRRLYGRQAGLLATLLASSSPLYVYYSQEARMYTQLTALGLAAAYALWRALSPTEEAHRWRWWAAFVLTAVASVYTHYFAFFFLAGIIAPVGVMALAGLPAPAMHSSGLRRPPATNHKELKDRKENESWRRSWPSMCSLCSLWFVRSPALTIAAALIFLSYLPWLPFVLNRYRVDASYWQGQLKLGEALRHTWISFTLNAPQAILEREAIPLAWGFAAIALLAAIGLICRGRRSTWATIYLLGYLLTPVVLILILSSRTPKFNPRYLMLASPACWLLLAGGLIGLHALRPTLHAPRSTLYASRLLVAFMLTTFAYANHSWFTDPRFLKADFRGAADHVRTHIAADEAVVLVSGHMAPVWNYYAGDLPQIRLPAIDVLDVNAVLSYAAGDRLADGLAGRNGAWLILWQDEVVDPNGIVADILEQAGQEVTVKRSFWQMRVRHFRWTPGTPFRGQPPIKFPAQVNLGGRLSLLGHSQVPDGSLRIYWQAQTALNEDFKVTGELLDAAGHVWGRLADRRLVDYDYPTFRWPPGQVVLGRYALPADPGTPPGDYRLRLRVYAEGVAPLNVLDTSGAPQGESVFLAPVTVPQLVPSEQPAPLLVEQRLDALLAPGLTLLGVSQLPPTRIPGDALTLETWWQAESALSPDLGLRLWWLAGTQRFDLAPAPLTGAIPYPTQTWPVSATVRGQQTVRVPREAPAGPVTLYGQVVDVRGEAAGAAIALGAVAVSAVERRSELPAVRWPADAILGERVNLRGADGAADLVKPGETLAVDVVWQAVATMDVSYTAFVHLLGPDGRVVAQEDHVPGRGARPTTSWLPGEVIVDRFEVALSGELAEGTYTLEVGLYNSNEPGFPRLRLDDGRDAVPLARFTQ